MGGPEALGAKKRHTGAPPGGVEGLAFVGKLGTSVDGLENPVVMGMAAAVRHAVTDTGSLLDQARRGSKVTGLANTPQLLQQGERIGEVFKRVGTTTQGEKFVGKRQAKIRRKKNRPETKWLS